MIIHLQILDMNLWHIRHNRSLLTSKTLRSVHWPIAIQGGVSHIESSQQMHSFALQ
jgi:hypothetical protein